MSRARLYDRVAEETASIVIRRYSTSFGLASRLLDASVRQHVENVYALVRVADEVVDGAAEESGLDTVGAARQLNELERETDDAMRHGFSANLVVHAFALTAREAGFGTELTAPFFDSMRTDLSARQHDRESFERYVHGSAEVVGLMCLRVFLRGAPASEYDRLAPGARALGAAFQKVNFLRDLAADFDTLGRSYFPDISVDSFTEADKNRLLDDIDDDLAVSAVVIRQLPAGSRRAVALAHGLFAELSARLRATPAEQLRHVRVRVPNPVKLRIAAATALGRTPPIMTTAIVIGGGISGLAASALLAKDGYTVTLLEARDQVGGRAGSWHSDGFRFDTGPSWYLMPEVFDHFYRLLGTSAEEQLRLVTLDPGYRVFFEGTEEPIDVSASRQENIDLFESIEKGAGPRLDAYLVSARETYRMAKDRFLYTSFADLRPIMTRAVLARTGRLARLLLQPLHRLVARTVRDYRLRQILGYPAVFLGSSPFITPSMYHLMSHLDLSDGVLYPMGGITRVIQSIEDLARAQGVTVVTDAQVARIVVEDGAAKGAEYVDAHGAIRFADADLVVSAADLHHTETRLLEAEHQTYPQKYWDTKIPGPSALLLYLGVRGELPQLEHHTLLFTREWEKGFEAIFGAETSVPDPASLYVCKPSGVDPDVAPEGFENLFVLVPIPADPTIGRGDTDGDGDTRIEVMADRVIAQLADWTGIDDLASRVVVRRTVGPRDFADDLNAWRGTALGPAHTLKQSAFFRTRNRSKKVSGLYYVGGSTIPGIGLPMCLISAEVLIKTLRGDVSTEALAEPLVRTVAESAAVERGRARIEPAEPTP